MADVEARQKKTTLVSEDPAGFRIGHAGIYFTMRKTNNHRIFALIAIVAALCLLAAAWRWTRLAEWLDVGAVATALRAIRNDSLAPWLVLAAYVIGSQIMFPITVLILATAYAFGPWLGFVYALVGSVLGAWVTYLIGYWIGEESYRRLSGSRFDAIGRALQEKGLIAVITTHLLPVGPFTFVNLAAGVARIGGWQFVLGCTIGMFPGIALTTLFEHQLEKMFREPGMVTGGLFALSAAVIFASVMWARRQVRTDPT
jgi:uncharacterized membrane protein YdjX (TVP38/TMEM64 family)